MRTKPSKPNLPRPPLIPGSRALRGSIIDMAGAVLTESDKAKIRAQFETATHVGAVKLAGLNAWAPFKGEAVSRYIGELQADGLIKEARDSKGKFAGWQLATDDE